MQRETIYQPFNDLNIPLPIGTEAYVTYKDTCYGICTRKTKVIKKENFGICFDNGCGNPLFDIIQYVLVD